MSLPSIYTQPVEGLENFEMSGDDLAVISNSYQQIEEEREAVVAPMPRKTTASHQYQIITQQEDEMYPNSTSETDRAEAIAEFKKFRDPNYKPARHLSWCIPEKCTNHLGPDVCHVGQQVTLERNNFDGDWYSITATPMMLEERGLGYTSVKYVQLQLSGQETSDAILNIDVTEVENVADWFCSLAEKLKQQSDKPGLNL
ncbi:MAG: hypothetical protein ACQEVD_16160 [Actinomycetota bacterium]